jgi:hypothetical protein
MKIKHFIALLLLLQIFSCKKKSNCAKEPILLTCSTDIPAHLVDDPDLDIDYIVDNGCLARATMPDELLIDAGVTIVFKNGGGFVCKKKIIANGTANKPITFRGETLGVSGTWAGIFVIHYAEGVFEHCVFDGAGSDPTQASALQYGSITSAGSLFTPSLEKTLTVNHCTFTNIKGNAFYCTDKWLRIASFENNYFDHIENYPIECQLLQIDKIGTSNTFGNNIGKPKVHIYQNEFAFGVDHYHFLDVPNEWGNQSVTWHALSIPYYFDDMVVSVLDPLTIEAGVKFSIDLGNIIINNRLTAIGTAQKPIEYSGQLLIISGPAGLNNEMAFWTIDGTKCNGQWASRVNKALVFLGWNAHYFSGMRLPGEINMHDCTFKNSVGYGFNHLQDATVTLTNNTFVNMALGNVIAEP